MVVFAPHLGKIASDFVQGLTGGGPRGLWVYGPRQSGTSTFARSVIDLAYDTEGAVDTALSPGHGITAMALADLQRKVWSQDEVLRSNAKDFGLWLETQELVDRWENLWNANVLLVDDLLSIDTEFWKKHILARLDQRLKGRGVTVLAGVVAPTLFGTDWSTGFQHLCRLVKMTGYGEG